MYILFSLHHMLPREYHDLDPKEKIIVRAFAEYEQEQIRADLDEIKG